MTQQDVLRVLKESGVWMTSKEIADELPFISRSSITNALFRLRKYVHLIEFKLPTKDKRAILYRYKGGVK